MKHALWIPSYRGSLLLSRLLCSLSTSLRACPQSLEYLNIYISINTTHASPDISEYQHLELVYSQHFNFVWNINAQPLDVIEHFKVMLKLHKSFGLLSIGILGDDEIVAENFIQSLFSDYLCARNQPDLFVFRSHLIDSKANIFYFNESSKSKFWQILSSADRSRISSLASFAPWDELLYGFHTKYGLSRLVRLASFFVKKGFLSPGNLACASYTRTLPSIIVSESHIIGSSTSIPLSLKQNLFFYPILTDRVYRKLKSEASIGRRPILSQTSSSIFTKTKSFFAKIFVYSQYSFFISCLPGEQWRKRPTMLQLSISFLFYTLLFSLSSFIYIVSLTLRLFSSSLNSLATVLKLKPFLQHH